MSTKGHGHFGHVISGHVGIHQGECKLWSSHGQSWVMVMTIIKRGKERVFWLLVVLVIFTRGACPWIGTYILVYIHTYKLSA